MQAEQANQAPSPHSCNSKSATPKPKCWQCIYLELVGDVVHDPGFPGEVKLQLDLLGQLLHSGGQVKLQLSLLQEGGSSLDVAQVQGHGGVCIGVLHFDSDYAFVGALPRAAGIRCSNGC